jgi:endogenous inhibitor of DNA gyrase (YacG/DUF329 family)
MLAAMSNRSTAGSVSVKRCPTCYADVLSAYRGEVTAIGLGEIVSVTKDGHVVGKCGRCFKRVVWTREVSRPG